MRRLGTLVIALALTATGCVEFPTWTETKNQHKAEAPPLVPVDAPPVTADQVNDGNAQQVLNALRDELDRAANEATSAPQKTP